MKQLRYNQARLGILDLMAKSNITIGDRLPAERKLVQLLNCSPGTVRNALTDLQNHGVIEKRHGLGSFLKKELTDDAMHGHILFVTVIQVGEDSPGRGLDRLRLYLLKRGLGLVHITVTDCGAEMVNAAKECQGILVEGWLTDSFLEKTGMLRLPTIVCGNSGVSTDLPGVSLDFACLTYRLTRRFIKEDARRVAIFLGSENYHPAHEQRDGYIRAMNEAGLDYKPYLMSPAPRFGNYAAVDQFMQRHPQGLDAIVMEHSQFDAFICWCWENNYPGKPRIGLIQPANSYRGIRQTRSIIWGGFPSYEIVAAEILVDSILGEKQIESRLLAPIIHGEDDGLIDFIG